MKIMIITTKQTGSFQQLTFMSDALADRAYEKIREAMNSYREYGNDDAQTVEFEIGDGPALFRTKDIVSVTLEDPEINWDLRIQRHLKFARWNKELKDLLRQEGLDDAATEADA